MPQKLIPETSLRLIYQTFSFTNSSQSSGVMAKPKYSIRGSVVSTTRLDRGFLCISQLCCLHIPSAESAYPVQITVLSLLTSHSNAELE